MRKVSTLTFLLLSFVALSAALPAEARKVGSFNRAEKNARESIKYIGLDYSVIGNSVDIIITGLPSSSRLFTTKTTEGFEILIPIKGLSRDYVLPDRRLLKIDDDTLKSVELSSDDDKLRLSFDTNSSLPPEISQSNDSFIVTTKRKNPVSGLNLIPNSYVDSSVSSSYVPSDQSASAPPVGQIVSGTVVVPNPSNLSLTGPTINLNIRSLSAYTALDYIAKQGNYDIVFVKSDPTASSSTQSPTTLTTTSSGLETEASPALQGVPTSYGGSDQGGTQSSLDNPRLISLTLRDKPYSQAFNSVLTASGLQASFRDGIIYVGPDIVKKAIGNRISQTFRLNQVSAQSAAQFLGNLGASMTYTNTVTTAVSTGVSSEAAVASASTATTTQSSTSAQVLTYGSSTGPLLGLSGTTDDRLSQVTLIGDPALLRLASQFLRRLDLRSRQVALSIKIYDVDLTNNDELSNQLSFTDGKTIFTSDPANSNVGIAKNFSRASRGTPGVEYNPFTTSATAPVIGTDGTTVTAPSGLYSRGEDKVIYNTFKALTTSKASKLLASPTIILMEENSSSGGSSGSSSNLPNQGTLFVGENVITGLEPVENSTACRQTFSQVGLNLKATLNKIDDNGFVTFKIEPTLTAPDSTVAIPGCGQQTIVTTSERKFVSGISRVRDGQTLILTGVISDRESSTTSKVPILGDIPIFGSLFRSSTTDRKKKELVLTVTPRVIKDDNQESYGYYMPSTSSIRSSMIP